jgi:hypothetical protein
MFLLKYCEQQVMHSFPAMLRQISWGALSFALLLAHVRLRCCCADILPGKGISADANGAMRAIFCPANTFGAPGAAGDKVFYWDPSVHPASPAHSTQSHPETAQVWTTAQWRQGLG